MKIQDVKTEHRTPIHRDSGFIFTNIEQAAKPFEKIPEQDKYLAASVYTRYGNPTVQSAEGAIQKLEGCGWTLLTSSGMSAIDIALSIFQEKKERKPWLFFGDIYGGTKAYVEEIFEKRRGIKTEWFEYGEEEKATDNDSGKDFLKERFDFQKLKAKLDVVKPAVLFFESISNPLLIVPEAQEIINYAKELKIKVVVDNTFATSLLWSPLTAAPTPDLIVHSATKYLGGHGNLTAGVICGNDPDLHNEALLYRKLVGCILSPDDAYRLETQLLTFEMRFKKQCENAFRLAEFLNRSEKVAVVRYPGLSTEKSTHPTFREAEKLFSPKAEELFESLNNCFGAMINFELKGTVEDEGGYNPVLKEKRFESCNSFVDTIGRDERCPVRYVPTLGDVSSILLHAPTIFTSQPKRLPRRAGLPEGMIRFSAGCEKYGDLENSFRKALDAIKL